jgi:eukaryotic-like serine/threonine-protein kinase
MSEPEALTESDDPELAELVAEIGERLRRGEKVRAEDYPRNVDILRRLMPTIKMMADLPAGSLVSPELGHLGDFQLLREVSRGGMGVVYEAVQVSLGRRVALKVLPNAVALDPRHLQRFHLEAQAAASLHHPHIVPVFATGTAEGIPYYAMKFIDGRDLARVILELRSDELEDTQADPHELRTSAPLATQGPSHAHEVARLARQAAEALEHAHSSDILHRDIKPSNLMIDRDGQLWITDFGLARVRGGLDLTHTGDALGTPRYMSPEQTLGRRSPLDGRTDIYSLGVTIYELLTLRPAYRGDDRLDILRRIALDEPTPPRKLDPTIPVDLETIVLKAIAKAPADRYATAGGLAADLGRFLANRPILARRPSFAERGARWMRRHRAFIVSATAGLVILVMVLAGAALQYASWLSAYNASLKDAVNRADRYAREAQLHANEADRHRNLADRHFLAAQLRLAQQALDARHLEIAQDLLGAIASDASTGATGEFAWHYLHRLVHSELVQLPERSAQLVSMAVSGDGQTAAAWYKDSMIVLWDLASERPIRAIGPVTCRNLVLSDDGRILAAERGNVSDASVRELIAWDTNTGRVLGQYAMDPAARGRASWAHLLARGRVLVSKFLDAGGTYSVRFHSVEVRSNQAQSERSRTLDRLNSASFIAGADFFVAREKACLRMRDAFTGAVRRDLAGSFEHALDPTISGNGRYLTTALGGDAVVVLDLSTGAERARRSFGIPLALVEISHDGNVVAAVEESGLVHVWDLRSGQLHRVKPDSLERGRVPHSPVLSPDGTRMATATWGDPGGVQPVAVWDTSNGRRLGVLPCAEERVHLGGFAGSSRSLVVSSVRSPLIWHFDPKSDSLARLGHKDEAWAVAYASDGKRLATGSDDTDEPETIKLWDPGTGEFLRGWNGGEGTVASLAFSPDGQMLASGHLVPGDNVKLWDVDTGRLLHTLRGHEDGVRTLAFSPDGRLLATGGGKKGNTTKDVKIRIWAVATASCVFVLDGHTDVVRSLDFAPDGRSLASAGNDQTVRLWDTATGELKSTQRSSTSFVALSFARDGETIMVADETALVTIRDANSLEVLRTIRGASDKLLSLAVAPDGRSLATCGMSGVIRLWDALTGQELLTLQGHKAQVNAVAFAPDGSSLASCSHDGEVKLWRSRSVHAGER